STKNQLLVKIYNEKDEKFCYIEPHDTVLILTREAVKVSREIAGTFHSKVGIVSSGFGHISTTLDPLWQGPLLISLNNPTDRRLKFTLAKINKEKVKKNDGDNKGNINFTYKHKSFVTLVFHRLVSPAESHLDNPPGRFDQLKDAIQVQKKKGWKKFLFWRGKDQHFEELKDMIDTIGSISFINNNDSELKQFGFVNNNVLETLNKESFYRNYENFTEIIKFYTDKAHATTSKIRNDKRTKSFWFHLLKIISTLLLIGVIVYLAWTLGVKKDKPAVVAYFALIIPLTATIVIPYFIKPLFKIFGRNGSE
ncbi:hypothetical protein RB298_19090, partial [Priestia sp. BR_2]